MADYSEPPRFLYRMRSMDALLYEHHELAKQEIFFPTLSQLNDPMEDFLNIFWMGDRIVWKNLFKHYIICIDYFFSNLEHNIDISGDDEQLPVFLDRSMFEGYYGNLHKRICDKTILNLSQRSYYNTLIDFLSKSERKVRKNELIFYISFMNRLIVDDFFDACVECNFISRNDYKPYLIPEAEKHTTTIFNAISKISKDEELSEFIESMIHINLYSALEHCVGVHKGKIDKNTEFLFMDLPKKFVKALEELLYPQWSVACFMEKIENPVVWSHYADGHKGACLIFGTSYDGTHNKIQLRLPQRYERNTIYDYSKIEFCKVKYLNHLPDVDFFRNIGNLSIQRLIENWYTDETGDSLCINDVLDDSGAWRKRHWDIYYENITTKHHFWKYENEFRIILNENIISDEKPRAFRYKITSLKGIIFGMNASSKDKANIAEIMTRKCKKHKITDFHFFQSYYDEKKGEMRYFELNTPLA